MSSRKDEHKKTPAEKREELFEKLRKAVNDGSVSTTRGSHEGQQISDPDDIGLSEGKSPSFFYATTE